MSSERNIIKADIASTSTFDYKAKEISLEASDMARSYVSEPSFRSTDFKISELIARQTMISQLENSAHEDKINAQVMERLKQIEERAYKEGHELGRIEGTEKAFQAASAELIEKMHLLEGLLKKVENQKNEILIDNEAELVRLVYLIARKIALRDLEENREAVLEILKPLVSELNSDMRVIVRLSSEDLYFLETLQDKTNERMELLEKVKLVPSEGVKPGGCMIETEYGSVNATVEERVERTWQTLQSRVPRKQPSQKE